MLVIWDTIFFGRMKWNAVDSCMPHEDEQHSVAMKMMSFLVVLLQQLRYLGESRMNFTGWRMLCNYMRLCTHTFLHFRFENWVNPLDTKIKEVKKFIGWLHLPSSKSFNSRRASRLSRRNCRSISWLIRFCSLASSDRQHSIVLDFSVFSSTLFNLLTVFCRI